MKKLQISRETIRRMDDASAGTVAGGVAPLSASCADEDGATQVAGSIVCTTTRTLHTSQA